jgi:hypothetical protein
MLKDRLLSTATRIVLVSGHDYLDDLIMERLAREEMQDVILLDPGHREPIEPMTLKNISREFELAKMPLADYAPLSLGRSVHHNSKHINLAKRKSRQRQQKQSRKINRRK